VSSARKRLDLPGVIGQTAAARAQGKTVVLANGVFDLFHVGHLRYLEGAKELGDVLVVGINSDASTRAYKGPERPVIPEDERAEIICGLECVDWVVIFDDTDARGLIAALRPDVHVKGRDYTPQTIPERDAVVAYGGRTAVSGDEKGHSSTEMVNRLKALIEKKGTL
jgi:rfaE bifunctional protein nucleotidyltransferase chain/domain